jgi:hypothetical protein
LNIDDLKGHGNDFLPFVKEQLPVNIIRAFAEILKTNQRVWVAYQRLLLTDILESNQKMGVELGSLTEKIDALSKQVQTLDNCLNGGQPELADFLWEQFREAKQYLSQSKLDLESFQGELNFLLNKLQRDFLTEIKEQKQYRKESRESLDEILERLGKEDEVDWQELKEDILPKYLQWIIQEYESINLPAIQEKKSRQTIPLERVYVALELTDEATRKDFQYGSQLIKQRIKEEEAACGRRLDEEERNEIRSKVIQKHRTLHSFQVKKMDDESLGDDEYSGFVTLDKVFQNERHLLILGDPGSGKSTITKWLTLQLAKVMLNSQEITNVLVDAEYVLGKQEKDGDSSGKINLGPARLPVLIKIPEYTKYFEEYQFSQSHLNRGRGIIDFCGFHIPTIPGVEPEKVQQLIKHYLVNNQTVVFLDGMDEVVKNRDKIIDEIEKFIQYWINLGSNFPVTGRPVDIGGNQIVVTSRVVGYHAAPLRSDIAHVYVREMDDRAIRSFCELWTQQILKEELREMNPEAMQKIINEEAEGLQRAIFDKTKPRIKELATNPLLVTILALLYRYQNKQLPKSRVELYEQSINILVGKWKHIHIKEHSISRVELNKLLEALAAHIHSSPSEEIREPEMRDILKVELKAIRGYDPDAPVSTAIDEQVENFIKIIKEDVGLLSERGEKLYHFLHRTFQEYLAARRLVSNSELAIQNIIDRLSDPVWREPVLLSVAYANSYWSAERFNQLVDSLLSSEDKLKDLVPRGILLIATALPDLENLSLDLFKKLVKEFLEAFGNREGIGRFKPIREAIKTIIDNLRTSDRKSAFFEVCRQLIEEPEEYGAAQWALLSLAAKDRWYQIEWVDHLLEHINEDSNDWDWPIDHILMLVYAQRGNERQNPLLAFRQKLIDHSTFIEFIQSDPEWLRLIMVLYGGIEYDPKVDQYKELEHALYQFSTKQVDMENEGYSIAVKLDTELGQVGQFKKNVYSFSPYYIHRESPFTRVILRSIGARKPAKDLIPIFYDIWEEGIDEDSKSQALLALAALGENVARIIYLIDDDSEETEAALRFLSYLSRLERNLSASFLSMAVSAKKKKNFQEWGWHFLPVEESSYNWNTFCKTTANFGLTPVTFFVSDPALNIYDDEQALIHSNWPSFILREAESYAAMIGLAGEDPVYSTAVVLDSIGKKLLGPDSQFILDALCEIPYTANRNNPYSFGWEMPEFWFAPQTEKEKLVFALQVAYGLPEDFYFLREFITKALWKRMEKYTSLQYYALSLFFHRRYSTIIEGLKSELLGDGPLMNEIIRNIGKIQDPYFKFLTAFYLNKQVHLLDNILFTSLEVIDNPKEWLTAYMLLHSKEVQIHIYIGSLIGLLRASETMSILIDKNPKQIILSQLDKITQPKDQIRVLIYSTGLLEDAEKTDFIFKAMERLPLIGSDKDRARSLQFILERYQAIATHFPDWDSINASFQDRHWLNRALSKEYVNLFDLQTHIEKEEENREWRSFLWNVYGLMRMSQELKERFEDGDIDGALIKRVLNRRKEKEALSLFLDRNKNGLPITNRNVRFVDELIANGREITAINIIPLMESTEIGDLKWIQHWAKHEKVELKRFYDLIHAESGYLNKEVIDSLVEILKHSSDRLKHRAAVALHGTSVDKSNEDRKYSAQNLGFETLRYLESKAEDCLLNNPEISLVLAWFNHNLVFDDPEMVPKIISLFLTGEAYNKKVAKRMFHSFERATTGVVQKLFSLLKTVEPEAGALLWRTIAKVASNDQHFLPHQWKVSEQQVQASLEDSKARESLLKLGEQYRLSSVEIAGEAILSVKDMQNEDWTFRYDTVKKNSEELAKIDFAQVIREGASVLNSLKAIGNDNYFRSNDVKNACQRYAALIGSDIQLIKILIKWTFDKLENDLIEDESGFLGGDLSLLLSEIAKNHREVFMSLVNEKIALKILPEVAKYHSSYPARQGAVELLSVLRVLNATTLDSIVKALKDVKLIRDKAISSLSEYSEMVDMKTLKKLESYLNGPSAQVSNEMARLLANISAQAALNTSLRKKTIEILSKALREQINEPSKRKSIYDLSIAQSSLFNLSSSIQYVGKIENTLYEELVKLSGL